MSHVNGGRADSEDEDDEVGLAAASTQTDPVEVGTEAATSPEDSAKAWSGVLSSLREHMLDVLRDVRADEADVVVNTADVEPGQRQFVIRLEPREKEDSLDIEHSPIDSGVSAEDKKSPVEERVVLVYATIRLKPRPAALPVDDESYSADKDRAAQDLDQAVKDRLGLGLPRRLNEGFEDGDSAVDHGEVLDDLQEGVTDYSRADRSRYLAARDSAETFLPDISGATATANGGLDSSRKSVRWNERDKSSPNLIGASSSTVTYETVHGLQLPPVSSSAAATASLSDPLGLLSPARVKRGLGYAMGGSTSRLPDIGGPYDQRMGAATAFYGSSSAHLMNVIRRMRCRHALASESPWFFGVELDRSFNSRVSDKFELLDLGGDEKHYFYYKALPKVQHNTPEANKKL